MGKLSKTPNLGSYHGCVVYVCHCSWKFAKRQQCTITKHVTSCKLLSQLIIITVCKMQYDLASRFQEAVKMVNVYTHFH